MASIDVDFDPADYLDEVSTKELQAELARRTKEGPSLDPDVFATIRRWAELAPPALAAEMRAWLFVNLPPQQISPKALREGHPIPGPMGRAGSARPPSDGPTHSLNPTISPFAASAPGQAV